jgi:hypothetical protein
MTQKVRCPLESGVNERPLSRFVIRERARKFRPATELMVQNSRFSRQLLVLVDGRRKPGLDPFAGRI